MNPRRIGVHTLAVAAFGWALAAPAPAGGGPRIESVVPLAPQPHARAPATIWYDDFDGPAKTYAESQGDLDPAAGLGGAGGAMVCLYEAGSQGTGGRKVFFGDSPIYRPVRPGEKFDTVHWRVYVKHQPGWTGAPDKMSRATSFASSRWNQAMIAHVWSSGEPLTLDPASGVRDGRVVTTRYNDFANLHWLGNQPVSELRIHAADEAGWWVCVEAMAKLNTPGRRDGENRLWLDGRPACVRTNLDWRGTWAEKGINAVFLEAYWNKGSPVTQRRWYDAFVISSEPIGPVVTPPNPVLLRAAGRAPEPAAWEVAVAADGAEDRVLWTSRPLTAADGGRVRVDAAHGAFAGGRTALPPSGTFRCRIRERAADGAWTDWSPWHQAFRTASEEQR